MGKITPNTINIQLAFTVLTPSSAALWLILPLSFNSTNIDANGTNAQSSHVKPRLKSLKNSLTDLNRKLSQIKPKMNPERLERPI